MKFLIVWLLLAGPVLAEQPRGGQPAVMCEFWKKPSKQWLDSYCKEFDHAIHDGWRKSNKGTVGFLITAPKQGVVTIKISKWKTPQKEMQVTLPLLATNQQLKNLAKQHAAQAIEALK